MNLKRYWKLERDNKMSHLGPEVERLEKLRVMGKKYRMNKREKELAMEKELAELRAKVAKAE